MPEPTTAAIDAAYARARELWPRTMPGESAQPRPSLRALTVAIVETVAPLIAPHETNRAILATRQARDFHEALKRAVMERDWLLAEAGDDTRARYHAARRAEQETNRG